MWFQPKNSTRLKSFFITKLLSWHLPGERNVILIQNLRLVKIVFTTKLRSWHQYIILLYIYLFLSTIKKFDGIPRMPRWWWWYSLEIKAYGESTESNRQAVLDTEAGNHRSRVVWITAGFVLEFLFYELKAKTWYLTHRCINRSFLWLTQPKLTPNHHLMFFVFVLLFGYHPFLSSVTDKSIT